LPAATSKAFTAVVEHAVRTHTQAYVQRRQEAQKLLLCDGPAASSSHLTVQQLVASLARQDAAPDTDDATALDADIGIDARCVGVQQGHALVLLCCVQPALAA
jgi:hypothetical protein